MFMSIMSSEIIIRTYAYYEWITMVLSYLWDDAYKGTLTATGKSSPCGGSGFQMC